MSNKIKTPNAVSLKQLTGHFSLQLNVTSYNSGLLIGCKKTLRNYVAFHGKFCDKKSTTVWQIAKFFKIEPSLNLVFLLGGVRRRTTEFFSDSADINNQKNAFSQRKSTRFTSGNGLHVPSHDDTAHYCSFHIFTNTCNAWLFKANCKSKHIVSL